MNLIRFNTTNNLHNGASVGHYILAMMSMTNKQIHLIFDGFLDEDYADKALRKKALTKRQDKIVEELGYLSSIDNKTEEQEREIELLSSELNELANELDTIPNYSELVIDTQSIFIPFVEEITEEFLKQTILDNFEDAKFIDASQNHQNDLGDNSEEK